MKKISIVTPSFNQTRFVEQTMRSVLDQNYPNLEYIVIDGGSTDGSVDLIKKYESRLAYFVSESDGGHGDALNKGFAKSTGEIMAWLNSDDMYFPWTLRTVSELFEQFPDINWLVGMQAYWNDRGILVGAGRSLINLFDYLDGKYRWIQQESVFWRRGLWERAGGFINEDYRLVVDGELWSRFFLYDKLHNIHCLLGGYRFHQNNRAEKFESQCTDEMERAIAAMRARIDPSKLGMVPKDYFIVDYNSQSSQWERGIVPRD